MLFRLQSKPPLPIVTPKKPKISLVDILIFFYSRKLNHQSLNSAPVKAASARACNGLKMDRPSKSTLNNK